MNRPRSARHSMLFILLLAAAAALPAMAQAVQPPPGSPLSSGGLLQVLSGLLAVLALMAGAAWLLRRMSPVGAGNAGNIRIVGGVSVGSRERVVVLEVADQWIVVGITPGSISALSAMPRQEVPAAGAEPPPGKASGGGFAAALGQLINQRPNR